MYSLTTLTFGQLAPLPFMELIARGVFWVAVAAWLFVVGALMVRVASRRGPKATVD